MTVLNITDAKHKRALLLHMTGKAGYDIFEGLVVESPPEDSDSGDSNIYTVTKRALDELLVRRRMWNLKYITSTWLVRIQTKPLMHIMQDFVRYLSTVVL